MALIDQLQSMIGDLNAAMAKEKLDSDARLAALRARRQVLIDVQGVITPAIERAFLALKGAGIL